MARRDYKFMPVVDAMTSLNQKINLIGAVIESGIPKVTRRADLFRSIRIIDESESTAGFYIHFFAKTVDKLPHANNFGDILVVSSVKVQEWNSNIHAMFLMQTSSFALYDGRDCSGNEPVPYQTSRNYKSSALDKASAVELRNWLSRNKVEDLAGLTPAMTFEHIKEGESVDFICKILHVCEVEDEWMFFLWDGTDTPPTTIKAKLEDEMEKPLPLQLEPSLLSRDILCTFPPVGTVLRMFVDKGIKKHGLKCISSNRWVKFLHVKCEIRAGMWCAGLMTFTKFFHVPDDADYAVQRQRSYDERVASRLQRMPVTSVSGQSSITGTDHPRVPCMTLMNVFTHPEACSYLC